jgi:hypothetical protein
LVLVERPFGAGFLRDWLPDDRVEDAEDFGPALGAGFEVPLFRDAGGDDVRVAMVVNVRDRLTRHMLHTPDRPGGKSAASTSGLFLAVRAQVPARCMV